MLSYDFSMNDKLVGLRVGVYESHRKVLAVSSERLETSLEIAKIEKRIWTILRSIGAL